MTLIKSAPVSSDAGYNSVRAILCSAVEAVQAKYGAAGLISAEDGSLQSYISYGLPPRQRTDVSVAHWVATHGQPLALETQEEAQQVPGLVISNRQELPLICVPIQVHGTILGALQLNFPPISERQELVQKQHTLKLAASVIGYVIENDSLRRELQELTEFTRKVNNISIEIQEAEREHFILELHDGVAQTLASVFQHLQTIEKVNNLQLSNMGSPEAKNIRQLFVRASGLLRQAIQETREIINSITSPTLDAFGLVPTLRQELNQFEKETKCQVDFRLATWPNLPKYMEVAIYRIIREAVNNVRKHAKSPRLEVEMSQKQKRLMIRLKDWGIGFTPDKQELSSSKRSIGIMSMRRRAELLGGTFKISSAVGKGTEILVDIPWLGKEQ